MKDPFVVKFFFLSLRKKKGGPVLLRKKSATPAVSVLIPIYNVEKYLQKCLDSVTAQKLANIEIICIDDGSTDSSPAILKEFAQRDERIRIISKANSGYGHSMNQGIALATGEYIGIVESDDFADSSMFYDMYSYAKRHRCDIVKANYFEHNDSEDVLVKPYEGLPYKKVFDPRKNQTVLDSAPLIWAAIYKRDLIVSNGISFNETPGASYQDTSFVFQAWATARRAALLPKGYLHYRVDNVSSSVKSSAKVFAVCDEYALSEKYLSLDDERYACFATKLNYLRLGTYRWNFNRIAEEHRLEFAERMRSEFMKAKREGTLDMNMFEEKDRLLLSTLIESIDEFMKLYGKGF